MKTDYLILPLVSLFALFKLYLCGRLYKKIESLHFITKYPLIENKKSIFVDILKNYLKSDHDHGHSIGLFIQICIYFCFNTILFSGNFVLLNMTCLIFIILFQFSLFFHDGLMNAEIYIKKIVGTSVIIVSIFLTFYAIANYHSTNKVILFQYGFLFLATINVFSIISVRSFFIGKIDNIIFNLLIVNFFSYTYCYKFAEMWSIKGYNIILLSELISFIFLGLVKYLEFYKNKTYYLYREQDFGPLLLSIVLIFIVKVF